jgi:hypothetical protein
MTVRSKSGGKQNKWSAKVTKESNALDLEKDIFKSGDADKIASSLKHSAEAQSFKTATGSA